MKIVAGIVLFSLSFSLDLKDDISFLYGMLGRLDLQDDSTMVLQDTSIIHTGDEVRINAGYQKGTHFYVIYKGSEGEFDLLYPDNNKVVIDMTNLPDTIYATVLPWIQFNDQIGFETFFLINSASIQEDLISLFNSYNNVNEKGRKKLAKKIQDMIENLNPETKQKLASIDSRLDKPIFGGITYRGEDGDELKDISLTHSCRGNFGIAYKKIVLNHR